MACEFADATGDRHRCAGGGRGADGADHGAGCATGVTNAVDADVAMRFCIEVAKVYGQGALKFYDEAEWAALQQRYGSLAHLQTVGNAPD